MLEKSNYISDDMIKRHNELNEALESLIKTVYRKDEVVEEVKEKLVEEKTETMKQLDEISKMLDELMV